MVPSVIRDRVAAGETLAAPATLGEVRDDVAGFDMFL